MIVETAPGKVVPNNQKTTWDGRELAAKDAQALWSQINLQDITAAAEGSATESDKALKLTANVLPDTYGIFCIHVEYENASTDPATTWIEVMPGVNPHLSLW